MKSDSFFKSKFFLIQLVSALIIGILFVWFSLFCLDIYTHHSQKISVPDLYGQSQNDYEKSLDELDLRYTILDSVFRPNMNEGSVVFQTPKSGSIVKEDRLIFLSLSTKKAEEILFPNIKNNSFRQAIDVLQTNGFSIGKLEYAQGGYFNLLQESKFKGKTVSYRDLVVKGSTIDLVLGLGSKQKIESPNLYEFSLSNAKDEILFSNFNLGQVKYDNSVNTNKDILNAQVWQQKPSSNMYLSPGQPIHIWLTCDSTKFKSVSKEDLFDQ